MYTTDDNIILMTDSYKLSHWRQYPPGTSLVYSYQEARRPRNEYVMFFGLQYVLKRYMEGRVVDHRKIAEAERVAEAHVGPGVFNARGWNDLLERTGGTLPVRIRAVREGSKVLGGVPLMTIENTRPEFYWLPNYLETLLSQTWYPSSVATESHHIRRLILSYLERTGTPGGIDFQLHDFGYRGVSSHESAGIGGAAHLVNFRGTDTLAALRVADEFYGLPEGQVAGFSIPASEHSTITSWGRDGEEAAYANMLDQYPEGPIACVSDSYDIDRAVDEIWGQRLHDRVTARVGTLVVRPDSGHPPTTVLGVVKSLGQRFGTTVNEKGFRVLDPCVRVIQGDGVDAVSINEILGKLEANGWSADNVAFGMGGALLQKLNRDTNSFAIKCSEVVVDGEARGVWKEPAGDRSKRSKAGRFEGTHADPGLELVFEDGEIVRHQTFAEVRKEALS